MTKSRLRRPFSLKKHFLSPSLCFALLVVGAGLALAQGSPAEKPATAAGAQCPLPAREPGLPLPSEFHQNNDYFLVVNDQKEPAEFYKSERPFSALVLSPALPAPALFLADSIAAVKPEAVEKKPGGLVSLRPEGVLAQQGTYEYSGAEVHFIFQGRKGALRPYPPLLGLRRVEEVTSHNPEYLADAQSYPVSASVVGELRKEQRPVTVRVYYGSWCPHCRKLVPHAVKLEQNLKAGKILFEYFGVSGSFASDPEIKKIGVTSIPTGIVSIDGREAGRIVGDQAWSALESTLQGILKDAEATASAKP